MRCHPRFGMARGLSEVENEIEAVLPTHSKVDWDETRLSSALLERRTAIETGQMLPASMASDLRIA